MIKPIFTPLPFWACAIMSRRTASPVYCWACRAALTAPFAPLWLLMHWGVTTGLPSVFIRASLCNLHCRWCDTDYTWNWQGTPWEHDNDTTPGYQKFKKETHLVELDVAEVARIVSSLPCYNVILTGGEPLLQDEAWCSLHKALL